MDRRRLPPYAWDALETLRRAVAASDDEHNGVSNQEVRTVEAGYYDVPHGTDLDEIAADLGISTAALSERLHRATKALVEDTLLVGIDPHD